MKTSEKANMHNQHWLTSTRFSPFKHTVGRNKLLRGYISQCSGSAPLNTLTITQLACECSGGPGVDRGQVDRVA